MESKEQGYTLIELVVAIALISLVGSLMMMGSKWTEEKMLHLKADEVAAAIEYAKQAASTTGESYALVFRKNRVCVQHNREILFTIALEEHQEIPDSITGEYMWFDGKSVSSLSTTIVIENKAIRKRGNIAVRVATSKIRVYYENI